MPADEAVCSSQRDRLTVTARRHIPCVVPRGHPALSATLFASPTAESSLSPSSTLPLTQLSSPTEPRFTYPNRFRTLHVRHKPVNTRPQGRLRQRRARKLDADQRTMV